MLILKREIKEKIKKEKSENILIKKGEGEEHKLKLKSKIVL